jgi:hypothetical protein
MDVMGRAIMCEAQLCLNGRRFACKWVKVPSFVERIFHEVSKRAFKFKAKT